MKILIIYNYTLYLIFKVYLAILEWKVLLILWCIFIMIVIYFDLFKGADEVETYEKYKRIALSFFGIGIFYVVLGVIYTALDIIRSPCIRKALSSRRFSPFSAASSGQRKVK